MNNRQDATAAAVAVIMGLCFLIVCAALIKGLLWVWAL